MNPRLWRSESQFSLRIWPLECQSHSRGWSHTHDSMSNIHWSLDYLRIEKEHKVGGGKRWGWVQELAGRVESDQIDQNTLCGVVKDLIKQSMTIKWCSFKGIFIEHTANCLNYLKITFNLTKILQGFLCSNNYHDFTEDIRRHKNLTEL